MFKFSVFKAYKNNMDLTPLTPVTMQSTVEAPDMVSPSKETQSLKLEFEECMPQLPESELRSYRLDSFNEKLQKLIDLQFSKTIN